MVDELKLILRREEAARPLPQNLRLFTHVVRLSAALACIASAGLAANYFLGFVENDLGFSHLVNAFGMSLGLGGMFFIPAFIMLRKTHRALTQGLIPGLTTGIFLIMLPWAFVGMYLQMLQDIWEAAGQAMIFLAFGYIGWGFAVIQASRSKNG